MAPETERVDRPVFQYKPYRLKDVYREASKELFTVVTTFSGGGGSSTGYKLGGGKILLFSEFIPEAVNTYLANYPDTPCETVDIRMLNRGKEYLLDIFDKHQIKRGEVDIFDGSPPCSTFSTAGKGKSKIEEKGVKYSDTTQDRVGMLIHDYVFMCLVLQPKVCIIENVPPIRSSDVFQHALERLRKGGYKINYTVMTSSEFGVPQRRKRMIAIGVRKDVCRKVGIRTEEDILDIYPIGSWYEPTIRDALEGIEVDQMERKMLLLKQIKSSSYEIIKALPVNSPKPVGIKDLRKDWKNDFNIVRSSWDHPVQTITATGAKGRGGMLHPGEHRGFTTLELKRLMSLPDDFILTGTHDQKAERCGRMVTPFLYKHLSTAIHKKVLKPFKV